jgi:hypothetical protein
MVKASSHTSRRAGAKKSKTPASNVNKATVKKPGVSELHNLKIANQNKYQRPKKTKKIYDTYVKNGKAFLQELIQKRQAEDQMISDDIDTDGLEEAFNGNQPNRYSADALELFLTHKCFNEGRGSSTADGIQGAWASYWDNM